VFGPKQEAIKKSTPKLIHKIDSFKKKKKNPGGVADLLGEVRANHHKEREAQRLGGQQLHDSQFARSCFRIFLQKENN
jgi:hypothetical protein